MPGVRRSPVGSCRATTGESRSAFPQQGCRATVGEFVGLPTGSCRATARELRSTNAQKKPLHAGHCWASGAFVPGPQDIHAHALEALSQVSLSCYLDWQQSHGLFFFYGIYWSFRFFGILRISYDLVCPQAPATSIPTPAPNQEGIG